MTRQETTSRGLTERDSSKKTDHHRDSAKRSRFLAKEKRRNGRLFEIFNA